MNDAKHKASSVPDKLELAGALHDAIGMGVEELEEVALVGHEPAEHGAMLTHCAPA